MQRAVFFRVILVLYRFMFSLVVFRTSAAFGFIKATITTQILPQLMRCATMAVQCEMWPCRVVLNDTRTKYTTTQSISAYSSGRFLRTSCKTVCAECSDYRKYGMTVETPKSASPFSFVVEKQKECASVKHQENSGKRGRVKKGFLQSTLHRAR